MPSLHRTATQQPEEMGPDYQLPEHFSLMLIERLLNYLTEDQRRDARSAAIQTGQVQAAAMLTTEEEREAASMPPSKRRRRKRGG